MTFGSTGFYSASAIEKDLLDAAERPESNASVRAAAMTALPCGLVRVEPSQPSSRSGLETP